MLVNLSIYVNVRLFNNWSPFSHFEAQKRGKLVGRGADYYGTTLFKFISDRWRCEGRNRIGLNFPDDLLRRLCRHKESRPCRNLCSNHTGLCRRR